MTDRNGDKVLTKGMLIAENKVRLGLSPNNKTTTKIEIKDEKQRHDKKLAQALIESAKRRHELWKSLQHQKDKSSGQK